MLPTQPPVKTGSRPASLLRKYVESTANLDLGLDRAWTWSPATQPDALRLLSVSPTTEYSSNEAGE